MKYLYWVAALILTVTLCGCKPDKQVDSVTLPRVVGVTPDNSRRSTGTIQLSTTQTVLAPTVPLPTLTAFPGSTATPTTLPSPLPLQTVTSNPVIRTSTALPVPTSTLFTYPITQPSATSTATYTPTPTLTNTPTSTQTQTPTRTDTPTPTATNTPTLTQVPQTGWGGAWIFYVEQAPGSYKSSNGTIHLTGLLAEGSLSLDSAAFSFTADVSEDQSKLNGSYQWGSQQGWLAWLMDPNGQQFRGSLDNRYAFCGSKTGNSKPEPCGYYSPY